MNMVYLGYLGGGGSRCVSGFFFPATHMSLEGLGLVTSSADSSVSMMSLKFALPTFFASCKAQQEPVKRALTHRCWRTLLFAQEKKAMM